MIPQKTAVVKRFILASFSLYLVLAVIVSTIHIFVEYKNVRSHIVEDLEATYKSTSSALSASLWNMDSSQVNVLVNGILTLNFIAGVVVDGEVHGLSPAMEDIDLSSELHYSGPIIYDFDGSQRVLGNISFYSSQDIVFERMKVNVAFIIANAFIKTFFLSLIMWFVGLKLIGRPLNQLLESVSRLDLDDPEKLKYSKVVLKKDFRQKYDDISALIDTYNGMLDNLVNRTKQRDEARQHLEIKNQELEQSVNEKTIALQEKIHELKQVNINLNEIASTDYLTKVLNRRAFFESVGTEVRRLQRRSHTACLVILDIDYFKAVNDTYGHSTGDIVLVAIAKLLSNNMRSHDLVARYGGEEFAILFVDVGLKDAILLTERIRQRIEKQHVETESVNNGLDSIQVTASFGLTLLSPEQYDIDVAIDIADRKLYQAKNAGRNRLMY